MHHFVYTDRVPAHKGCTVTTSFVLLPHRQLFVVIYFYIMHMHVFVNAKVTPLTYCCCEGLLYLSKQRELCLNMCD